jgi:multicomponent Na+:H+ antiporter subunit B
MGEHSTLVSRMTSFLYPFIILFGFTVIVNGHLTPGGGFQGGAVLATLFICRYLVTPTEDLRINTLQVAEKILFILIIMVPVLFLFLGIGGQGEKANIVFMILTNTLIGLKVCAGLTVIFYRFMFYEGGNRWTL